MTTYTITGWDQFEHPTQDKRALGAVQWWRHPATLNSRGRLRLLRLGDSGIRALVVFDSLISLHCERPRDRRTGQLINSDGSPMEIDDIADAIHMDAQVVEESLLLLSSDRIGWLSVEADEDQSGSDSDRTRTGSGSDPDRIGSDSGDRSDQKDSLRDGTLRDGTERNDHSLVDSAVAEPTAQDREVQDRPPPKGRQGRDRSTAAEAAAVAEAWNAIAGSDPTLGFRLCRIRDGTPSLPKTAVGRLAARVADCESFGAFLADFRDRAARVVASPWHRGGNDRGWKADITWLLEPGGWDKAGRLPLPTEPRSDQPAARYQRLTQLERDFLRSEGLTDANISAVERRLGADRSTQALVAIVDRVLGREPNGVLGSGDAEGRISGPGQTLRGRNPCPRVLDADPLGV